MAPPVQLAPGSLALVLSPREAGQAAGEPGGRALFRAFRRANARCFWNARLARAASRLAFLGCLQRRVLLVRAPQPCVQVLRDAWRRRALRSPRGFRITAVGECGPGAAATDCGGGEVGRPGAWPEAARVTATSPESPRVPGVRGGGGILRKVRLWLEKESACSILPS